MTNSAPNPFSASSLSHKGQRAFNLKKACGISDMIPPATCPQCLGLVLNCSCHNLVCAAPMIGCWGEQLHRAHGAQLTIITPGLQLGVTANFTNFMKPPDSVGFQAAPMQCGAKLWHMHCGRPVLLPLYCLSSGQSRSDGLLTPRASLIVCNFGLKEGMASTDDWYRNMEIVLLRAMLLHAFLEWICGTARMKACYRTLLPPP